jgi:hypothetical protein
LKRSIVMCFLAILTGGIALPQGNPVPLINNPLVPMTTAPGGSGLVLTVNGTGFVADSEVMWNGSSLPTTFVSGSQLTASIPASSLAVPTTAWVRVTSPVPQTTSNIAFFHVSNPISPMVFTNTTYATGYGPNLVASGDFDGDGTLDLAVTSTCGQDPSCKSGGSVSVFLGNSDGTFKPQVVYPAGNNPYGIVAGDFTNDGNIDLAVANAGAPSSIFILAGNGDGTFGAAIETPFSPQAVWLATGDFNEDGNLDLVVTDQNYPNGGFTVLFGNGHGSFVWGSSVGTGYGPTSPVTGDFNRDGHLDIAAVVGGNGSIAIALGQGNGTFSIATYVGMSDPMGVWTADLNNDAILDLAVTNGFWPDVLVSFGNGDGTFGNPHWYPSSSATVSVVTDDYNADGILDIAADDKYLNQFTIIPGPSFNTGSVSYADDYGWLGLTLGDFDRNGKPDLAIVNTSASTVSVMLQASPVLSRTLVNFGEVSVGGASPIRRVRLKNAGSSSFSVNSITLSGGNWDNFRIENNCPPSLAAGGSCVIGLRFKPTVTGRLTTAVAISEGLAPGTPQIITLKGIGR